jgi:hypothetical protein
MVRFLAGKVVCYDIDDPLWWKAVMTPLQIVFPAINDPVTWLAGFARVWPGCATGATGGCPARPMP